MQANQESRCSGGCELLKSSQVTNPSGGGGTTYPNTSHQKRARRSGSAQAKVTWNFLIDVIGPPYGRVPFTEFPGFLGMRVKVSRDMSGVNGPDHLRRRANRTRSPEAGANSHETGHLEGDL